MSLHNVWAKCSNSKVHKSQRTHRWNFNLHFGDPKINCGMKWGWECQNDTNKMIEQGWQLEVDILTSIMKSVTTWKDVDRVVAVIPARSSCLCRPYTSIHNLFNWFLYLWKNYAMSVDIYVHKEVVCYTCTTVIRKYFGVKINYFRTRWLVRKLNVRIH